MALDLSSNAQQAKPKNTHVALATLQITVTLNGSTVQNNQLVVWVDPNNDISGSQLVMATPDAGGWVVKQLQTGNYSVNAWAPGLSGFAENVANGWVVVTAPTTSAQIEMRPQRAGSFWVHVLNAQGQPAAGVTVDIKPANGQSGGEYRACRCLTFGAGLCSPRNGTLPAGNWSVSIPGQAAKQVTMGKDLAPVAVEFKQK
jgi:hypothetical protein